MTAEYHARFEAQVLPHLDAAYTLARYLLGDEHDAQDAVQDAFLRAWRHFDGVTGTNTRAWLFTIVRHCCASARRKHRGADTVEFDELLHSAADERATPESVLRSSSARESFHAALRSLPEAYREVLVLREVQDMTYEEIALIIGAPVGTVMSRLSRARERMRQLLRRDVLEAG